MNLRDKLNAISGAPKPKPKTVEEKPLTCYHIMHLHPAEEFPWWNEVSRRVVMLMQGEDMPLAFDPSRILYLDTETTGFQGAGTVAFLIGAGFMGDDGFEVHQYVMRDYPEEPAQLKELEELLRRFDVLCTFNGRSFDVPLLRSRFLMNRMKPDCLDKPHIDLLHIARRVWKLRLKQCRLGRLEEAILGRPREDDLPGSEAPQRYFTYLKTGEFHLLDEVLKHNEQDVASMCTLLAHMHRVYETPELLTDQEDVYQMGLSLERMHHPEEARHCYRLVSAGRLRAQGQLRLAASYRRAGDRPSAKQVWLDMIDRREGGALPYLELAKHYEHIERDPAQAMQMTRYAMALLAEPSLLDPPEAVQLREQLSERYHRLSSLLEKQRGGVK